MNPSIKQYKRHAIKKYKYLLYPKLFNQINLKGVIIKVRDIRSMSNDELNDKLKDLELELAIERRKIASTGVQSKAGKVGSIRKSIARIFTIINERGAK